MSASRTLVVIKPDGVRRGLVGGIISRFEQKGFAVADLRMLTLTEDQAKEFYSPHSSKPFFGELVSFVTSGPVVAAVLEGNDAIAATRLMVGATKSSEASPGSIRGDYGLGFTDNIIHASDSEPSFERESRVVFT